MFSMLRVRHLRWTGHVCRPDDGSLPKDILYGELADAPTSLWLPQAAHQGCPKEKLGCFQHPSRHLGDCFTGSLLLEICSLQTDIWRKSTASKCVVGCSGYKMVQSVFILIVCKSQCTRSASPNGNTRQYCIQCFGITQYAKTKYERCVLSFFTNCAIHITHKAR